MTSLINSINSKVETDVNSDGFITTIFPAGRAGTNLQVTRRRGEFKGVINPTTPYGSYVVKLNISPLSIGITLRSILSANPPKYQYHSA